MHNKSNMFWWHQCEVTCRDVVIKLGHYVGDTAFWNKLLGQQKTSKIKRCTLAKGKALTTMDMSNFLSMCSLVKGNSRVRKALTCDTDTNKIHAIFASSLVCTQKNATIVSLLVSHYKPNRQHPKILCSLLRTLSICTVALAVKSVSKFCSKCLLGCDTVL